MLTLLLMILVAGWLLSSNIKWILVCMAAFMVMTGSCRRRGDEAETTSPPVVESEALELSPTGLPIQHKTYYAPEPGQLAHDREW